MSAFHRLAALAALLIWPFSAAAQSADMRALLAAPIVHDHPGGVTALPIDVRYRKLFINAALNGEAGEFIFDTGSPTILSREFADRLGLETLGENTGTDAHGNQVTMQFVRLETLALAGVVFHDVPVLVFDFDGLDNGSCLIGDGVIGSEIFAGLAWQIDTEAGEIRIAADAIAFADGPAEAATRLSDFGYPHAPVIQYAIGEVSDNALFDTGSAAALALFEPVASAAMRAGLIPADSIRTGFGSEGESAGGRGDAVALRRSLLNGLVLDGTRLDGLSAQSRAQPPTLLGAGMLNRFVVTLDYPGERFLLHRREQAASPSAFAGFGLSVVGEQVEVTQLYEGSAAAQAGLALGDRVLAVDNASLSVSPDNRCAQVRYLAGEFDAASATQLTVQREGGTIEIHLAVE